MPITATSEFAPAQVEAGVGLALQDGYGRYLFFLAGHRHRCPPGELLYAGIGGHREPGESWAACAQREALEEIGCPVRLLDAPATWHLAQGKEAEVVRLSDRPRPLALYEMIHPPGTPRAGGLYRLVIFSAVLEGQIGPLSLEEVRAVIGLTQEQVIRGPARRPSLDDLLAEGAVLLAKGERLDGRTRLYPLGTAAALAQVLQVR